MAADDFAMERVTNFSRYIFRFRHPKGQVKYEFYHPTLGCDIQGFQAMGLSAQY